MSFQDHVNQLCRDAIAKLASESGNSVEDILALAKEGGARLMARGVSMIEIDAPDGRVQIVLRGTLAEVEDELEGGEA